MAFYENQLITWANQGATTSSAKTYNSIKTCIDGHNWNSDVKYSIYLQGSYKNSTNIRGDSDVDVVVEFSSVFYSNSGDLEKEQFIAFDEYYSKGKYSLDSFKTSLIKRLKSYYGEDYIKVGNKSIKVLANSGRLDCDVVICAEYREYKSFSKNDTTDYAKGIVFWTTHSNKKIINFPNLHYFNGTEKNKKCYNKYKPTIRVIKNMKSNMIDKRLILSSLAPSYFVECLMYNVANSDYQKSKYSDIILSILNTFHNYSDNDLDDFVCQNYRRYLFGNSEQQWNKDDCKTFIKEIINFWNNG